MSLHIVIPARYDSQRLPGKALLELGGKPIIQHVYEKACQISTKSITIATDNLKIKNRVEQFGGSVCLTKSTHQSGTDRIAEAVESLGVDDSDWVINIQGDEPLIPIINIQQLIKNIAELDRNTMATLCTPINNPKELINPNTVKVVKDNHNFALYFSRAIIPWDRNGFENSIEKLNTDYFRHIGIYAYSVGFIKEFVKWPAGQLEKIECLEQLRVLEQGRKIHVDVAKEVPPHGVDTAQDLEALRSLI